MPVREFVNLAACEGSGIKAGIYLGPLTTATSICDRIIQQRNTHHSYAAQLGRTESEGDYGKIYGNLRDGRS